MYTQVGVAAALLLFAGEGQAADKDKEPSAIVEIGGAGEWSLQNGGASLGPSIAVEVEPIKEWLELEAGFTLYSARAIPPSGAPIFCSRSPSHCPRR